MECSEDRKPWPVPGESTPPNTKGEEEELRKWDLEVPQ